jgi:hypothetical protein
LEIKIAGNHLAPRPLKPATSAVDLVIGLEQLENCGRKVDEQRATRLGAEKYSDS